METRFHQKTTTADFIQNLVSRIHETTASQFFGSYYWFTWLSSWSLMAVFTYLSAAAIPESIHLPENASFGFWLEALAWLALSFVSAGNVYRAAKGTRLRGWTNLVLISGFIILLEGFKGFSSHESLSFMEALNHELDFSRGPCGGFVFLATFLSVGGVAQVLKRAAPTQFRQTGFGVAIASGAQATFFMHLVCTHESSFHVFIWHILPLLGLMGLTSLVAKKLFRWS